MRHEFVTSRSALFFIATVIVLSLQAPVVGAAAAGHCHGRVATIVGTSKDETIDGTSGPDVIAAGAGDDSVNGGGGRDLVCGDEGDDHLVGGRGRDRVFGGPDRDWIRAGYDWGDDRFNGGGGRDWLDMSWTPPGGEPRGHSVARVDLARGVATEDKVGRDRLAAGTIENVYGTGLGDLIVGDERANELVAGLLGNGKLKGGRGDDVLGTGEDGRSNMHGGSGDDQIEIFDSDNLAFGGVGRDEVSFCGRSFGTTLDVSIDLAAGVASMEGSSGSNSLDRIESAHGCSGDDVLRGDRRKNRLRGMAGDDDIDGRGGDDHINGSSGHDRCVSPDSAAGARNCEEP